MPAPRGLSLLRGQYGQPLIILMAAVGLTRDRVADPALCDELDRVGEELRVTLNELRELARGTYPAILTEAGLGPALESVVQRASVPATLASAPEGRLPAPVEATAYFVVSEALANAAKHANASSVTVSAPGEPAASASSPWMLISMKSWSAGVSSAPISPRTTSSLGAFPPIDARAKPAQLFVSARSRACVWIAR